MKQTPFPKGYRIGGFRCGLYPDPEKPDLAMIISERPAAAAAAFTTNRIKAAPVYWSRGIVQKGKSVRAVVANSGCANCCTGKRGFEDSRSTAALAAHQIEAKPEEVLVCSTGVIGEFLPMDKLSKGIRSLGISLMDSNRENDFVRAARAIMTTDTVPKIASRRAGPGTVWGMAKGAGMIHPRMTASGERPLHATMLCFLLTDLQVPRGLLQKILNGAIEKTFNRVSVDGDTSTNDTVLFLANGAASSKPLPANGPAYRRLVEAVEDVCGRLARAIAADGEGASQLVTILVKRAPNPNAAKRIAETVATSNLLKTALYGRDPNWGRVLGAVGRAGVAFNPAKIDVYYGKVCVCRNGFSTGRGPEAHEELKGKDEVVITIDLKQGKADDHYWTCDFSPEYVTINADYS